MSHMIECSRCGGKMSSYARHCPECGAIWWKAKTPTISEIAFAVLLSSLVIGTVILGSQVIRWYRGMSEIHF